MGRSVRESAAEQAGESSSSPSTLLLALEVPRAAGEFWAFLASAPWLGLAPRGDGQPVLVLPGFMASDESTFALRAYLESIGYEVQGWQLGRNMGPTKQVMDGMLRLVEELAAVHEEPVSVVGWSLGGVYARELAHQRAELVRQVITLGSPFRLSSRRQSSIYRLYEQQSHRHDRRYGKLPALERVAQPPPVPSTAIYTRTDGVVSWETCIDTYGPKRENIEVLSSHCGLGLNPAALWAVADRLAPREGAWKRFKPPLWLRPMYPAPEYASDEQAAEAAAA
jgi:pimeloyl-ACP methyl ester carboxylesterase